MTTIMPLMFGFFSLSFSVGLSIYFVTSNLVGILQYSLMGKAQWSRLLGREEAPAPAVVSGSATRVEKAAEAAGSGSGTSGAKSGSGSASTKSSQGSARPKSPRPKSRSSRKAKAK
jgi:YidC/Oxa1 family membrane protein insertase